MFLTEGNTDPRLSGMEAVRLGDFLSNYPRTHLEYFDRAVENVARLAKHPTDSVILNEEN